MSIKNGIKLELEQYDKETNDQFREILNKQYQEMNSFKRNHNSQYGELLKTKLSESSIQSVRDTDERAHLIYQKNQIEYFYHADLAKIKKKHQTEINNFSDKRLKGRMNIISSYSNLGSLSLTPSITTPRSFPQTLVKMQLFSDSNVNTTPLKPKTVSKNANTTKPKKIRNKSSTFNSFLSARANNSNIKNELETNSSNNFDSNIKSPSFQLETNSKLTSSTSSSPTKKSQSFTPSRNSRNSSPIRKKKNSKKVKTDEEVDFLDPNSLKKHFEKADKARKKMEEDRQHRFEENFSYIVDNNDVIKYSKMNLIDKNQLDEIQNKSKIDDPKFDFKTSISKNGDNKEEALIAPINNLDDQEIFVSEDSYYSSSEGVPINDVALESSYESYYSEYEIEEKIYVSVPKLKRNDS